MRRLLLFCVCGLVIFLTTTSDAEVQNVKVGGDLTIYGIYRDDFDLDSTTRTDASVSNEDEGDWFMSSLRLRVDADLTDNVAASIGLINERDWDQESATSTDIDLDIAFITLKEAFFLL